MAAFAGSRSVQRVESAALSQRAQSQRQSLSHAPSFVDVGPLPGGNVGVFMGRGGKNIKYFEGQYGVHVRLLSDKNASKASFRITVHDRQAPDRLAILETAEHELRQAFSKPPEEHLQQMRATRWRKLHIFVDDSNITLGARNGESSLEHTWRPRLSYRALLQTVSQRGSLDIFSLVVCGSSATAGAARGKEDAWRRAAVGPNFHLPDGPSVQFQVRTPGGGEAFVDDRLCAAALERIAVRQPGDEDDPPIIVLLTGDGNNNNANGNGGGGGRGCFTSFLRVAQAVAAKGWQLEIWSWQASTSQSYHALRQANKEYVELNTLDPYRDELMFYENRPSAAAAATAAAARLERARRRRPSAASALPQLPLNTCDPPQRTQPHPRNRQQPPQEMAPTAPEPAAIAPAVQSPPAAALAPAGRTVAAPGPAASATAPQAPTARATAAPTLAPAAATAPAPTTRAARAARAVEAPAPAASTPAPSARTARTATALATTAAPPASTTPAPAVTAPAIATLALASPAVAAPAVQELALPDWQQKLKDLLRDANGQEIHMAELGPKYLKRFGVALPVPDGVKPSVFLRDAAAAGVIALESRQLQPNQAPVMYALFPRGNTPRPAAAQAVSSVAPAVAAPALASPAVAALADKAPAVASPALASPAVAAPADKELALPDWQQNLRKLLRHAHHQEIPLNNLKSDYLERFRVNLPVPNSVKLSVFLRDAEAAGVIVLESRQLGPNKGSIMYALLPRQNTPTPAASRAASSVVTPPSLAVPAVGAPAVASLAVAAAAELAPSWQDNLVTLLKEAKEPITLIALPKRYLNRFGKRLPKPANEKLSDFLSSAVAAGVIAISGEPSKLVVQLAGANPNPSPTSATAGGTTPAAPSRSGADGVRGGAVSTPNCAVCLCEVPADDGLTCAGGHFSCKECLDRWVDGVCTWPEDDEFADNPNPSLPCPERVGGGCAAVWTLTAVSRKVSEDRVNRWIGAHIRRRVDAEGIKQQRPSDARYNDLRALVLRVLGGGATGVDATEFLRIHGDRVEDLLTLRCPTCQQAYADFDDCCALECYNCRGYFCAFCHESCNTMDETHRHVRACPLNPSQNLYPEDQTELEAARRNRRIRALREYLTLMTPDLQRLVVGSVLVSLSNVGITEADLLE